MTHSPDCPACMAAEKLSITGAAEVEMLHAMASNMLEADMLFARARDIGFDLSDDVIDTLAECLDTAQQDAAVLRAHMN